MGRGRAKAKQTKVARELKYSSPGMDLDRLSRDLHTDGGFPSTPPPADDDPHAAWDDDDEDSAAS
jgi:hypothetical protein